jgi:hypothetical protein
MFFRHALRLVEILTLLFPDSTQIAISAAQHFRLRSDSPYGHKRMTSSGTTIRFGLSKPGRVAEVASVGGFVKQCSVIIDPTRMRSLGISLQKVRDVIRDSTHGRGRPHSRTWRARVYGARPRLISKATLERVLPSILTTTFSWSVVQMSVPSSKITLRNTCAGREVTPSAL